MSNILIIEDDENILELEKDYLEILIETKKKFPDYDSVWCGFQTVEDYNGKNNTAL